MEKHEWFKKKPKFIVLKSPEKIFSNFQFDSKKFFENRICFKMVSFWNWFFSKYTGKLLNQNLDFY